jgi:hypothetical protein
MAENGCACTIVFRYWRNFKLYQLIADVKSVAAGIRVAHNTSKKCEEEKIDWLAEVLPLFGEPIISGTRFGLQHRKTLF